MSEPHARTFSPGSWRAHHDARARHRQPFLHLYCISPRGQGRAGEHAPGMAGGQRGQRHRPALRLLDRDHARPCTAIGNDPLSFPGSALRAGPPRHQVIGRGFSDISRKLRL